MNEELLIAIDELRKRPSDRTWFLPALLDSGTLPSRAIGAGESLEDLQCVDLNEAWDDGIRRLLLVIDPPLEQSPIERALADWLQTAVHLFHLGDPELRERWIFHLKGADGREKIDVRVEAGLHYQAADTLRRLGALSELRRHKSYIAFAITERGRLLLSALRPGPATGR